MNIMIGGVLFPILLGGITGTFQVPSADRGPVSRSLEMRRSDRRAAVRYPGADTTRQAQVENPGRHSIGYRIGVIQMEESNLMDKVHQGILHLFGYGYEREDRFFRSFCIRGGFANVGTTIEEEAGDGHGSISGQLEASYTYTYRILKSARHTCFAGPRISYDYSISSYPRWDESRAYWGSGLSLGVANRFSTRLKNAVTWKNSFDLSLIGLISRPDEYRTRRGGLPAPV